jgi:hypothetical protein
MEAVWWVMKQKGRRLEQVVDVLGMEESRREASFVLADTWWKAVECSSITCDPGC